MSVRESMPRNKRLSRLKDSVPILEYRVETLAFKHLTELDHVAGVAHAELTTGVYILVDIAADCRSTRSTHAGDAHSGHAVAESRMFAGRKNEWNIRHADPERKNDLRELTVTYGVGGREISPLFANPWKRDHYAGSPEALLQVPGVLVQGYHVAHRIGESEKRA